MPSAAGVKNATYEIREREALDWPLATASVALKMKGGKVSSAKIVLGHVAPTPWEAPKAAESLAGKTIDEATAEEAGKARRRGRPAAQPERLQSATGERGGETRAARGGREGLAVWSNHLSPESTRTAVRTCAGKACTCRPWWIPSVGHSNDGLFWCHNTHNCLGPDGKLVDDYECNETRNCYQSL